MGRYEGYISDTIDFSFHKSDFDMQDDDDDHVFEVNVDLEIKRDMGECNVSSLEYVVD